MPDLYLEPYDGPSADEFLDPDRPYQELSEEEEEALIEKMAIKGQEAHPAGAGVLLR